MAEFLSTEEGKNKFASKGVGNAGLTLGIIGTALGAINSGILGGNGILGGIGGGNMNGLTTLAAGAGMTELARQEMLDQEYDLIKMADIEKQALKDQIALRERDIAEKADIYRQSRVDDNRINASISAVKDYATTGLVDVFRENASQFRSIEKAMGDNKLSAYKDMADLYRVSVTADKNLELQIERNREEDQKEKFGLYKDLSEKNTALAYATMKQSYEDRLEAMKSVNALATRVSALEKDQAVTAAQLPLMFGLTDANTKIATCRKMDGNLTINPSQISQPLFPPPFPVTTCPCNS